LIAENAVGVQRRRPVEDADRVVGDAAVDVVREVSRVQLPDAGLVRRVHDEVGLRGRPRR
jgi:hypothetical protein